MMKQLMWAMGWMVLGITAGLMGAVAEDVRVARLSGVALKGEAGGAGAVGGFLSAGLCRSEGLFGSVKTRLAT